jgi:soluble lytic murein transglycosylase-like protein
MPKARQTHKQSSSKTDTKRQKPARHSPVQQAWIGISAVILMVCGLAGFVTTLGAAALFNSSGIVSYEVVERNRPFYASSPLGPAAAVSPLSSAFTPEVLYWEPLIKAWAILYQIGPNLIATVIQIESCGDPNISSPAGAQGLFQVMPFHFDPGEDMLDVQTNAKRGLNYLTEGLQQANGHAGLALAGYNGGHGVIDKGWATWASETQRYYYWGSRIYAEAISGMEQSPTLQEWLNAGGQNLCLRADESQRALEKNQAAVALTSN